MEFILEAVLRKWLKQLLNLFSIGLQTISRYPILKNYPKISFEVIPGCSFQDFWRNFQRTSGRNSRRDSRRKFWNDPWINFYSTKAIGIALIFSNGVAGWIFKGISETAWTIIFKNLKKKFWTNPGMNYKIKFLRHLQGVPGDNCEGEYLHKIILEEI